MEIYVVTSGCYSDYGIDKIFLDKDKAEHFVEWSEDRRVEVYNTDDDYEVNEVYKVVVHGDIAHNGMVFEPVVCAYKTDRIFQNSIYFNTPYYGKKDYYDFGFIKYIKNNNYDKEFLHNKYRKFYYDLANIIKYHLIQGANEHDINEMLKFYWESEQV